EFVHDPVRGSGCSPAVGAQGLGMHYSDLRDFLGQLERMGELKRVQAEVSPRLEMTEVCDRVLRQGGPAILFERVAGHSMPVLGNLFGTVRRACLAMG